VRPCLTRLGVEWVTKLGPGGAVCSGQRRYHTDRHYPCNHESAEKRTRSNGGATRVSSIPPTARVQRRSHLLENELSESEAVMLDIESGTYFGLRDVAKAIWDRLEQPVSVSDLCLQLMAEFEVDPSTCRRDVDVFLSDLSAKGLLDIEVAGPSS
jgi:hypothetical protein